MANEEEVESFEISDYDLAAAYNPGARKSKKFTKNQQIYGVWAEDESEGEDVPPTKTRGFGFGSQKDYTAPMGFVKGGVQQAGKPKADQKSDVVEEEEEIEEEIIEEVDIKDEIILNNLASKGKTGLRMPSMAKKQHRFAGVAAPSASSGMGQWEKHTKGIGAKLLLQMGYEPGRGLGKALQGRVQPVEAVVRKGRGAIGAYGSEKADEKSKKDEDELESEAFLKQMKALKERKEDSKGPGRKRYVYKTMDEVIAESTEGGLSQVARNYSQISKTKVIDMTGPEQRVLSGYHSMRITRKDGKVYEEEDDVTEEQRITKPQVPRFAVPELTHNLDMLVDICEQDIITNATELGREQDRFDALQSQEKTLAVLLEKEEQQLLALQAVMTALENLSERSEQKPNENVWDQEKLLYTTVETLYRDFPEEFKRYGLAQMSLSFITSWLQRQLPQQWSPLADDSEADPDLTWRGFFHRWRKILSAVPQPSGRMGQEAPPNAMLPYDSVLWHAWFPVLRTAVRAWDVKKAAPLLCCIQRWNALLPDWLMHIILEQLVFPRLEQAVQLWDPMSDLVPLHSWLQPWITLLVLNHLTGYFRSPFLCFPSGQKLNWKHTKGNDLKLDLRKYLRPRLETLYPTIRQKLAGALAGWHPSDSSAHSVLLPWVGPMGMGAIQAFVARNILHKLGQALETWPINPQAQQLDVWHWVMKWEELTSPAAMAELLQRSFFPRWLQVLVTWLNHMPNYDEVVQWFVGWKKMFSPALAEQPIVRENFARVLELMNQAVGGEAVMVPQAPPPVFVPMVPPMFALPVEPMDFREMVERQCAMRGIIFVPLPNKRQHGRPVFKVGNQLVYFDKQVIFVQSGNGTWIPCSLQHLLDMAQ